MRDQLCKRFQSVFSNWTKYQKYKNQELMPTIWNNKHFNRLQVKLNLKKNLWYKKKHFNKLLI